MRRTLTTAESVLGSPARNLVAIVAFMVVVVTGSTIAYMAAGWSFTDAVYMVVLTVYTVGYDEVRAIDTPYLHVVTLATIVLGCTGMIFLTSALVQFSTGLQLRQFMGANRMQSRIDKLTRHTIICGFGRIGVMLARELADGGMPLVVVDQSADRLREAESAGHLCLAGDATSDDVLVEAGIAHARVLATVLPNDAANVFITLSARNLNAGVEIIARGEAPSTETKLRHAGANRVVLPTHIGAERIARMILHPGDEAAGDGRPMTMAEKLDALGLRLDDLTVADGSAATRLTLAEVERDANGAFVIVRVEGGLHGAPPRAESVMRPGDRVVAMSKDGGEKIRRIVSNAGPFEESPADRP